MFHVLKITRDLDGREITKVTRAKFVHERHAEDYVRAFANDALNWKIDFELVEG